MELLQLKYFIDAAETESFSVTAKKYGVPPSGISQSIKRLENELELPLFERSANRILLNKKGRDFYQKTKEALLLLESAVAETRDDGKSGKIKICVNCNKRIVMKTIEKFCSLYPEVDIITRYGIFSEHDKFDLIVSSDPPFSPHFSEEKIVEEKMCLAVNCGSPLASAEQIDAELLANESFITMSENSSLYNQTRQICSQMGFEPRMSILVDDPLHVIKCVELGLGVAIAPTISWKGQISDKLVLKNLGDSFRNIYIFTNEKRYISKSAKIFLQMLRDEFCTELKE